MDFALLGRSYYEGNPYKIQSGSGAGLIRINILEPLEEYKIDKVTGKPEYIGPGFSYEYNIAALRIDRMVSEVLPQDAVLVITGFEDDENQTKAKELLSVIANLGAKYQATPDGFVHWMRQVLTDVAQTGDRLGLPKFVPEDAMTGRPGRIRLMTFDYAAWDAELDAEDETEVVFYRIEEKRWGNNNQCYWHRFDIYPDQIKRYSPQLAVGDPPGYLLYPGMQDWEKMQPHYFPGVMNEQQVTAKDKFEADAIRKVGGHLAVPIRYMDRALQSYRGQGEIQVHDMRTIDRANRHLIAWSNATEETNFPTLLFWDAIFPKGPDGKEMDAPNFRTGSQWKLMSSGDKDGRAAYPENIPTQFAYGDYLEQCLTIAYGQVPFMGRKPEDMRAFAELSGFAHGVMMKMMNDRVDQIRQSAINEGFIPLLHKALRLADAKGILPADIDAGKVDFKMLYGSKPVTADEALKQMLTCESGLKLGVPIDTVVRHLPFAIANEQEVVQGIQDQMDNAMAMTQAIQDAKLTAATSGAANAAGVDKQAR